MKPVADALLGKDQSGSGGLGFELLSERGDENAEVVGFADAVRSPDLLEQVAVGQRLSGVADHQREQVELRLREPDLYALAADRSGRRYGSTATRLMRTCATARWFASRRRKIPAPRSSRPSPERSNIRAPARRRWTRPHDFQSSFVPLRSRRLPRNDLDFIFDADPIRISKHAGDR